MESQATGDGVPTPAARGTAGGADADWPARVADTVESAVAAVHDKVVRPLVIVARALVFGTVVATMALVCCTVVAIALVRVLDVYAFGNRVWASDALIGVCFVALGAFVWSKRRARGVEEG